MSFFKGPNGTGAPPDPDYEWRYEYYDDEEPVSFEGLAAHRYSIVISFWVGLAVFVIFMFFVLTLLTKTGAPHPDGGEPCEKRVRLTTCVDTLHADPDNSAASPPRPRGPDTSRRLFQCYVTEEDQGNPGAPCARGSGGGSGRGGREEEEYSGVSQEDPAVTVNRTERESVLPAHFNIPNFVNSEHSLTLGEDDLLLRETELPIILEGRGQISTGQHMAE